MKKLITIKLQCWSLTNNYYINITVKIKKYIVHEFNELLFSVKNN